MRILVFEKCHVSGNTSETNSSYLRSSVSARHQKSHCAKAFTEWEVLARVQSVKSSNAIEGIITGDARIKAIVEESRAPLNHN